MRCWDLRVMIRFLGLVLLVTACAAPSAPGAGGPPGAAQVPRSAAPKILRIAVLAEPSAFIGSIIGVTTTTGGAQQPTEIAHNWLVLTDSNSEPQPALAVDLPAIEKGTWRVLPDGGMETTWKLRPNVQWHDGAPFTADDVLFGWEVVRDPAMPSIRAPEARFITAIDTPDPLTLVMKWNQIWVDANDMRRGTIDPLPRHLIGDLFNRDKDGFINSAYWSTEFVGLGPFKVAGWTPGAEIDFARFESYFRGPAHLDRVILRFIPDANTQLSAIFSEEIDMTLPIGVDMEGVRLASERWAGTKNQVLVGNPQRLRFVSHQGRVEDQKQPALLDARVRRALYQAMDRQELASALNHGFGEAADSFIPPNHSYRRDVEASIPTYRFDPAAASRALAELGWNRGGDGTLRSATGAPFTLQIQATRNPRAEKEVAIIADGWRQLGIDMDERLVPSTIIRDPETWHRFGGVEIIAQLSTSFWKDRIHSKSVVGPENRWNAANFGSYVNPAVDDIVDRLSSTIERPGRITLMRELLREAESDLAVMPIYWDPDPVLALARVKNLPVPSAITQVHTWNIYDWDLES
jgi:peptide/nickel transport system substrate-binding protein